MGSDSTRLASMKQTIIIMCRGFGRCVRGVALAKRRLGKKSTYSNRSDECNDRPMIMMNVCVCVTGFCRPE